jgi:hypothetical protein
MMENNIVTLLKNGDKRFCLHNGYCEFSYGCPKNPLMFEYEEFLKLDVFFKGKFGFDIIASLPARAMKHIELPDPIKEYIGMDIAGVYYLNECIYENDAEKNNSLKIKEEILSKIKNLAT